jgi:hypothetical protein
LRSASGLSPGTTRTYGSLISVVASNGPSGSGAAEREVQLTGLDRGEELRIRPGLGEPELDAGPVRTEATHDAGKHAGTGRLVRADAEGARLSGAEGGDVRARGIEARDDRLGVPEEQLAGLGERDRPRTSRPLDERLPDDLLERRDLLADG